MLRIVVFLGGVCLAVTAAPTRAAEAQAEQWFSQGVQAFRAADFHTARKLFLRAEQAGKSGSKLAYNLGVVHYRLGDYAQAENYFQRASADPATRQVAFYNLGRCAQARGLPDQARRWYRRAREGEDPRLAELARRAEASVQSALTRNWRLEAGLNLGFDSSVVGLIDQVTARPTRTADLFEEAQLFVGYEGVPAYDGQLAARLSAYQLAYETVQQADLQSLAMALNWRADRPDRSRWGWQMQLAQEWLDNQSYQLRAEMSGRYEHGWQSYWLSHKLAVEWFEAQQQSLGGIDGARYELSTALLGRAFSGLGMFSLFTQFNERQLEENSPRRFGMQMLWQGPDYNGLSWQPSLQWRDTHFPGEVLPKERRWRARLRLVSDLSTLWQSIVDVEYERNSSDLATRAYRHTRVTLGLRWSQR